MSGGVEQLEPEAATRTAIETILGRSSPTVCTRRTIPPAATDLESIHEAEENVPISAGSNHRPMRTIAAHAASDNQRNALRCLQ